PCPSRFRPTPAGSPSLFRPPTCNRRTRDAICPIELPAEAVVESGIAPRLNSRENDERDRSPHPQRRFADVATAARGVAISWAWHLRVPASPRQNDPIAQRRSAALDGIGPAG